MSYVTGVQLAEHLNLGGDPSSTEVPALDRAVAAASTAIDKHCGRTFSVPAEGAEATARRYRPASPVTGLFIDDAVSVELVEESRDGATWVERPSSLWWGEPLNAADDAEPITMLCSTSPWLPWVRVTAVWGWPAMPDQVPTSTLIKGARLYKRKDSPTGVEGMDGFGVTRISRFEDGDVQLLLAPLRRADRVVGVA